VTEIAPMSKPELKFVGVELYFERLPEAKHFYNELLGLQTSDEEPGRFAKFDLGSAFVCLERKGSENYPSQDKAVLFFEVADVHAAVENIGRERFVHIDTNWAVLHDPEGHNVLLLQTNQAG
jgi:predicted enzyme related to lactoylglutathione lyase